jgi:7-carboxy-7-deazaguanine synthase
MEQVPSTAAIPVQLQPQDSCLAVWSLREEPVPCGIHAGTPAVVLRLQGCPVGCPWCNAPAGIPEPTIADEEDQASEEDLERGDGQRGWRWLSGTRLLALIGGYQSRHVLITGGEPALYDLAWFSAQLLERGYSVQVETSGVLPLSVDRRVWVSLSPKHQQPGGLMVRDWLYRRANEVIQPVTGPQDARWLDRALKARCNGEVPIWLLPLTGRPDLQELAWDWARTFGVRLCAGMPHVDATRTHSAPD